MTRGSIRRRKQVEVCFGMRLKDKACKRSNNDTSNCGKCCGTCSDDTSSSVYSEAENNAQVVESMLESCSSNALLRAQAKCDDALAKGREHFVCGNWNEAIDAYSEGLAANPTCETAIANRALMYLKVGQPSNAIPDCEAVLLINPMNIKALYRYALATKMIADIQADGGEKEKEVKLMYRRAFATVSAARSTPAGSKNDAVCKLHGELQEVTRDDPELKNRLIIESSPSKPKLIGLTKSIRVTETCVAIVSCV
ncbi:Tom34 [Carpediemonas membranifera]|uniref:Tom34 n=1 Tax=Carpediemonas membranifera TaxID=201153 RepID=A0A8J6BBB8_9EUKA|nr:Tom34 [Carpediemonas membranifera]|eukprot:KAG9397184.1 Tom34 [Carpediemonas membranifera]